MSANYQYFPGCSLKGTGRAYEESFLATMKALGPWWGWGNVVSLILFATGLWPLFHLADGWIVKEKSGPVVDLTL